MAKPPGPGAGRRPRKGAGGDREAGDYSGTVRAVPLTVHPSGFWPVRRNASHRTMLVGVAIEPLTCATFANGSFSFEISSMIGVDEVDSATS